MCVIEIGSPIITCPLPIFVIFSFAVFANTYALLIVNYSG